MSGIRLRLVHLGAARTANPEKDSPSFARMHKAEPYATLVCLTLLAIPAVAADVALPFRYSDAVVNRAVPLDGRGGGRR